MTFDNKKPANRKRSWRCLARRLCHSLVTGATSLILFLVVGAAKGDLLYRLEQGPFQRGGLAGRSAASLDRIR